MATRSISTTTPAVACDVCGRTLLRGEQPDSFLDGGQRRVVCELCVNRAVHEGWLREADDHTLTVRPPRGRRGRSLMGRLRGLRDTGRMAPPSREQAPPASDPSEPPAGGWEEAILTTPVESAEPVRRRAPELEPPSRRTPRAVHAVPTSAELKALRALEVFNSGEAPRRIAGIARSLGAPEVTARSANPGNGLVSIVVAWELCWYRWEVELADEDAGARLTEQGTELDELHELDRVPNATADEHGMLRPAGA